MITNKKIDNGSSFDFGMVSQDYARYRDIYPKSFYNRIYELGFSGIALLDFFQNGGCGVGAAAHVHIIHADRIIRILRRQRRRYHRQKQRHGAYGGQQARPTVSVPHLHALHRSKWLECVVSQRLL